MKTIKLILPALLIFGFIGDLTAQTLKTGDGESSILFGETTIGVDVGKTEISFTTNNYLDSKDEFKGLLWGVSLKGKQKDGLSSILRSSELIPSSSIQFNLGYFSSPQEDMKLYKPSRWNSLEEQEADLQDFLSDSLFIQIERNIKKDTSATNAEKLELINRAKKALSSPVTKYKILKETFSQLSGNPSKSKAFRQLSSGIHTFLENHNKLNELFKVSMELVKLQNEALREISETPYKKFTIYGLLELSKGKFNTFDGWNPEDITESFDEVEFDGSRIGVGAGYRIGGNTYLGGRLYYEHTNNSSFLTSKKYEYEQTNTVGNETFTLKDEVTAYSGTYGELNVVGFDFDFLRYLKLGQDNFLILDAYLRSIDSRDKELLPSKTDIGLSSSFFKSDGKFIGGIYLELPDFDQGAESLKEEPEFEIWYKRLSIGLYTKFSFQELTGAPIFK
jgi:hypothetical protein